MRNTLIATVGGVALLAGASAQAAGYDVIDTGTYEPAYVEDYTRGTLTYAHVDDDFFGDEDYFFGDIEGERQFGNWLAFGGLGFYNDDFGTDYFFEAGVGYYVSPNVLLGAKVNHWDFDGGGDFTDVSIFGQYEGARGAVGLSFTDQDGGDDFLLFSGEYMISSTANIGGIWYHDDDYNNLVAIFDNSFGNTAYSLVVTVDDDDFRGAVLYLEHMLNDRTQVFGAVGASDDNGFSGNFAAIGAGYKLADNLWLKGSYGRYDTDFNDGDVFALSLQYEIGKSKRVERRVENRIRDVYEGVGFFLEF